MKGKLFGDKIFYQQLWHLTLPIAFQSLMLSMVAAADAFMLGRLEQNAMSAVSLATQIQFVQNIIFFATVTAAGILGAQYWGKGDQKALNDIFGITLRINGIISILFFLGCCFFPRFLMMVFTNEEVLIQIGVQYLQIAGWSYLFTGISQTYLVIMKVSDHASMTAKISSGAVVLNIALNVVFIFGLFGLPALGVQGAALATLIARVIELGWAIGVSRGPDYVPLHLSSVLHHNKLLQKDYTNCLWPLIGANLLWGIGFTSYSSFMGHMGTDAAAANSVCAVIRDLICCLNNGLASGGGILVGNQLGAGELKKGKIYGDRVTVLAFLCGGISAVLMFLLAPVVLHFVKMTPQATTYLFQMMLVMSIYMIGRAVNTIIISGIFSAGGDTIFDMYSLAVTMWGIAIPLAAIGTFWLHWPVWIVYACTCLDEVGKIPWVMVHYKKYKWVKDLTREMSAV